MIAKDPGLEGLEIKPLEIPEIRLFRATRRYDHRGYVVATYNKTAFAKAGITTEFVHENHCWSPKAGTVRGFHYQRPPYGQPKLIRVTRGRIFDVSVDIRRGSPTFGQHVKAELTPDGWNQILVPEGFAHCYCTLEDDTEVIFKLGCEYASQYADGFAWNDPNLNIDWPISETEAIVLKRDLNRPRFSELSGVFSYPAAIAM
ncbi:MAG: dTDP-4-dehydrorhamnose 3,5-epimerase [Proteobacteria bacterium]|nr:dTDP-4-dehydrorhamnose 3,5-epimerase [Pseudomonadota bacterium]